MKSLPEPPGRLSLPTVPLRAIPGGMTLFAPLGLLDIENIPIRGALMMEQGKSRVRPVAHERLAAMAARSAIATLSGKFSGRASFC
jgi:hypothetical protein